MCELKRNLRGQYYRKETTPPKSDLTSNVIQLIQSIVYGISECLSNYNASFESEARKKNVETELY